MIKFTILILTHNRVADVERCFKSLVSTLGRSDVFCAVLDNASTDNTFFYLCREVQRENVLLLRSGVNLGVAGGRDELLKTVQSEYVVFLDSDTVIADPAWLDALGKVLDENENIGMVGPGGSFVKRDWSGFEAAMPDAECDVVAGYCQVFRRSLLDLGVHIDTSFAKFWTEDSDLAMQIREKGWDVYCLPVGVMHYPAHSGYGQEPDLHDAHIKLFREKWQGKGLIRGEGAY